MPHTSPPSAAGPCVFPSVFRAGIAGSKSPTLKRLFVANLGPGDARAA